MPPPAPCSRTRLRPARYASPRDNPVYPTVITCTARGFWDTGLKPTPHERRFEVASGEIGLA